MEKLLQRALRRADQVEIFSLASTMREVGFSGGILKNMQLSQNAGVALRVIKDGRIGIASSSNLDALDQLLEGAMAVAELGQEVDFDFSTPAQVPELDLYRAEVEELDLEELAREGQEMVDRLGEVQPGLQIFSGLGGGSEQIRVMTSHGLDVSYRRSSYHLGLGAQLVEEGNILTVYDTSQSLGPWGPAHTDRMVKTCRQDLSIGRKTVPIQSGPKCVIFTPQAMADIFLAFEGAISASSIAKGTSPLVNRLEDRVLDSRVTILDDALHPEGPGSCPFDDEGVPTSRMPVVENGILRTYLTDRRFAKQIRHPETGNGMRHSTLIRDKSFTVSPAPDGRNFVLSPGEMSLEQMMHEAEGGLLVKSTTRILLGNLINGDFSGSLELAFLLSGGVPVGRVKNVMISGNFYELFGKRLVALGNDPIWTGNFGGEAGSYSLPHTLFEEVAISA